MAPPSSDVNFFAESSTTLVGDEGTFEFEKKDFPGHAGVSEGLATCERIGQLHAHRSNELIILEAAIVAAGQLSLPDAYEYIEAIVRERAADPWYDPALLKRARLAIDVRLELDEARELVGELQHERLLIDDSPYLEVRAAVSNTDDPSTPVDTFRSWFLGLFFVVLGTSINTFFSARLPSIGIRCVGATFADWR